MQKYSTTRSNWDHLQYFSLLWGFAMLWHQFSGPYPANNLLSLATVLAAVALILRPRAIPLILGLAVIQLAEYWSYMPGNTNHWTLVAFLNIALLSSTALVFLSTRQLDREQIYARFVPIGRWIVLLMYFFATFHKLNTDFFDPVASCAVSRYVQDFATPYGLPDTDLLRWLAITGTIVIEGGIPLLLLFPRTRIYGIALGLLFHGGLALGLHIPFFNFSGVLFACFWLFVPADFPQRLHESHAGRWRKLLRSRITHTLLILGAVLAAMTWFTPLFVGTYLVFVPLWVIYILTVFYFYFTTLWQHRGAFNLPSIRQSLTPLPALHIGLIVIFLLNGFAPFLGFKSEYSFNMHSNLRTDDGTNNHLLMPDNLLIWTDNADVIEVMDTDQPFLKQLVAEETVWLLQRFDMERLVANDTTFTATVRYQDQIIELSPENGYAPFDQPNFINLHFRRFQASQTAEVQACLV